MKVIHVIPSYEPAWHLGGVVRSVSQLCRGLAALGIDVTVYTTDSGGDMRLEVSVNEPVRIGGVRVIYFPCRWSLKFRYSPSLGEACRRNLRDFDIVHLTTFWCYPGIPAGHECRRQGIPYVVSPHGVFVRNSLRESPLKKRLYMELVECRNLSGATAIHYTSELEKQQSAHLGLPIPSFVIPNGLDFSEFDLLPHRRDARQLFELSVDDLVVAYLGRLHQRKALDLLVEAFADVAKHVPNAYLLLAGPDDGYETVLRTLVQNLGITQRVRFLGFVNQAKRAQLLAATDLVALVARAGENFGYAAVEAMAAGVPVLVSDQVGICEEVKEDRAGSVVPVDKEIITGELKSLLSQTDKLQAMGERAYRSARRRYSVAVVAEQMTRMYENILGGR